VKELAITYQIHCATNTIQQAV